MVSQLTPTQNRYNLISGGGSSSSRWVDGSEVDSESPPWSLLNDNDDENRSEGYGTVRRLVKKAKRVDSFDVEAMAIAGSHGHHNKEYPAKIHVRSKLHYFPLIKDRLNEACRSLFRTTCFGPWLDITYMENDDGMIHYVIQKQCCADDDSFELPLIYNVNGRNLHFGRSLIEDEEKFFKVSDEDAIRLCLLLSLEVIFIGLELVSVVDDILLRMVNNLDAWNTFPWGEYIWRQLYDFIRNVSSKHKLEHLDGLRKNPNHVPSYSLSGFLFA
nr:phospholipase-like protein [Tanacetum cinerariifolium]